MDEISESTLDIQTLEKSNKEDSISSSTAEHFAGISKDDEGEGEEKSLIVPSCLPQRDYPNIIVFTLVILFGLSSWIVVNGLYTALPIFMLKLPESYEIATDMNLALQLANVFPFTFFLLTCLLPLKRVRFHIDTITVFVLITVGIVACVLMTFLWDHTSMIGGKQRSFAFLSLVFITGAVDCTSSVVYWPFIANYKYYYTTALSIGEGSTALVSGIIGLIMQPGPDPLFSFPVFAGILAIILGISGVAFTLLRFLPYCKRQLIPKYESELVSVGHSNKPGTASSSNSPSTKQVTQQATPMYRKIVLSLRLLTTQMVISFIQNGILVSVGPYIFHSYPKKDDLLRYSILLTQILDPFACFLAYPLIRFYHWSVATVIHLVWITLSVFQFAVALKNPNSPRAGSLGMGIGLVVITIVTRVIISFAKTSEWLHLHREMRNWKQSGTLPSDETANPTSSVRNNEDNEEEQDDVLEPEIVTLDGKDEPNHQNPTLSKRTRFVRRMDINPFRIAGIGIQIGSLLGSIMMFLLTKYHVLRDGY